jgi:DNA-binding GntR family transcriptional regulator
MKRPRAAPVFELKSELQNELASRIKELIRSRDPETEGRIREAVLSRVIGVSRTPVGCCQTRGEGY